MFSLLTQFMANALGSDIYIVPGAAVGPTLLITDPRAIKIKGRLTTRRPYGYEEGNTNKINGGDNIGPYPEDRWLSISALDYPNPTKADRIIDQNGDNYEISNIRPEYGANELAKNYVTCHPLMTQANRNYT